MAKKLRSTPPARGATRGRPALAAEPRVAIHAPRAGGDIRYSRVRPDAACCDPRPPRGGRRGWRGRSRVHSWVCCDPRPPRGGRLIVLSMAQDVEKLRSTPPARGATRDRLTVGAATWRCDPRPPRGGRPARRSRVGCDRVKLLRSTPPARGATMAGERPADVPVRLRSTPPARGATAVRTATGAMTPVAIHAPRAGGDMRSLVRRRCSTRRCDPRPPRGGRP